MTRSKVLRQAHGRAAGAAERVRGALGTATALASHRTAVTFRDQLKASMIVLTCTDLLEHLGCPRRAVDHLRPALQHFEALVYRGDLAYEEHQRSGTLDTAWREGLDDILAAYGLATDAVVVAELAALDAYCRLETEIMTGARSLDTDGIHATCYSRSSHIRLLLRFAERLAGFTVGEEFTALARHVFARDEVVADCLGYPKDVAEDSFNTLRLQVRLHGVDRAAAAQEALYARILRDLDAALARAGRPALQGFVNAFLPRPTLSGAWRHEPCGRVPHACRLAPPAALRAYCRRGTGRSRRLAPVPVPTPVPEGGAG
ncbi:hypothetical protein ACFQ2B_32555 [Streptomyces stramineus]